MHLNPVCNNNNAHIHPRNDYQALPLTIESQVSLLHCIGPKLHPIPPQVSTSKTLRIICCFDMLSTRYSLFKIRTLIFLQKWLFLHHVICVNSCLSSELPYLNPPLTTLKWFRGSYTKKIRPNKCIPFPYVTTKVVIWLLLRLLTCENASSL